MVTQNFSARSARTLLKRTPLLKFLDPPLTLCVAQNGVVLELRGIAASQNCHSCQFANKQAERGYYDESDIVLCVK